MERAPKQLITIAGYPGSGKSTAAKLVAARLGFEHLSGGDLYRAIGKEQGLDILQANLANEKTGTIDKLVDDKLVEINNTRERMVIDSRTAWHFIPASFKVFLDIDLRVAAERILANMDEARLKSEHIPGDPAQYAASLKKRMASETRRYKHLYNIEPFNIENYDLVVDTQTHDIEQTVGEIIAAFQHWAG